MNVNDYTYLMNKPDAITEKQADALGSVLNEFPYFQSARALRLKGLYDQSSFKYNYALKVTAAHTTDRSVLFDFITSETFTSIQSEYYDKKLRDLLEIKVFDSEIVSFEEVKKVPEVRIDPIEQSILNSIKEATSGSFREVTKIEEEPVKQSTEEKILITEDSSTTNNETQKAEEPKIELIDEEAILDSFKEVSTTTFEEPQKIEEPKIEIIDEQAILDSFKEVSTTTFEEPQEIEEPKIEIIDEQAILDSFKEVSTTTFEEPQKIEEPKIEIIDEQVILDSFQEVTATAFEEPQKTDEPKIEIIDEQIILDSFKEVSATAFEEPQKIEEPKIEIIDEQIILDSFQEVTTTSESVQVEEKAIEPIIEQPSTHTRSTFFDEIVEDEADEDEITENKAVENKIVENNIPEVRIDPIEQSILNSIKEASTAVFEQPKIKEEPEIKVPETVKIAEENLEIGKPLDFSAKEKHSFQEWLQLARTEPIDRSDEVLNEKTVEKTVETKAEAEIIDEEKKKKAEIIDKFIETNPKISPIKQTAITPAVQFDINKEDNSYLMTETLARVYLEQKKYTKAIQAYEILILKYPEKISFFADRISDIKILQQNNNNN